MGKVSSRSDLIMDYYKDWDSYSAPIMLMEASNEFSESLEAEESKGLKNLRRKYQKSFK